MPTKISAEAFPAHFWAKVSTVPGQGPNGDCWEWQAGLTKIGYGQIQYLGKMRTAHRLSYELSIGSIPDKGQVLHRCDNRRCVNPSHLFIGSHNDNMADMVQKGRAANFGVRLTHCKRGHEFTAENTVVNNRGNRSCKTCQKNLAKAKAEEKAKQKQPRTHCLRGHEFTAANTIRLNSGKRTCRTCRNISQAKLARMKHAHPAS